MPLAFADDPGIEADIEALDDGGLEELDKAATKIQSAYRGKNARQSIIPKQRRLRTRVDKNIVREVTAEEEAEARVEAAATEEGGDWRYSKVGRFTLEEGGKLWMCSDQTLASDAIHSQAVVTVAPTKPNVKPPKPTYKTLKAVSIRQSIDPKSAICGELEPGETVTVLELIDTDPPKRKRKVKASNKTALRSGTPNSTSGGKEP